MSIGISLQHPEDVSFTFDHLEARPMLMLGLLKSLSHYLKLSIMLWPQSTENNEICLIDKLNLVRSSTSSLNGLVLGTTLWLALALTLANSLMTNSTECKLAIFYFVAILL